MVTISELGSSTDPNNANIAKVKFTVRTAGQYKISVLIGSSHIAGSPFFRTFIPGAVDARRSRLVRPASTVVCCAGSPTLLHIEPRDEYGNACIFENDDDPVQVISIAFSQIRPANYVFLFHFARYRATKPKYLH